MKRIGILILFAAFGCIAKSAAQKPTVVMSDKTGWHKIGETSVNFQKDRDEIVVIGSDKFASVKFKVTDAPIEISAMDVYYESGDMQKINVNANLKASGESKVIDLNGGERSLKKVVFVYKTLPNFKDKKAHVELWGLKTNTDKK